MTNPLNPLIPYELAMRAEQALAPTPRVEAKTRANGISALIVEILFDDTVRQILAKAGRIYDFKSPFEPIVLAALGTEYMLRIFPDKSSELGGFDVYLYGDRFHKNSEDLRSHEFSVHWKPEGDRVDDLMRNTEYLTAKHHELNADYMKRCFIKGLDDTIKLLERAQHLEGQYKRDKREFAVTA